MFEDVVRAHRRSTGAIGFAVLMLAMWTALFCYSVAMLAIGSPQALICFVGVTLIVREPMKFGLELLPLARVAKERGTRIRAIEARRHRRH